MELTIEKKSGLQKVMSLCTLEMKTEQNLFARSVY